MANEVQEVRLFWSNSQGKRAQNVFHMQAQTAPVSANPLGTSNLLATALNTALQTLLLDVICSDTALEAIGCRRVNNGGGPAISSVINAAGNATGNSLSMIVAANCVLFPDSPPFQRKEGHIYFPAVPEQFVDGDAFQTAGLTAYTNLMNGIYAGVTADGANWLPVIYDRKTSTASTTTLHGVRANVSGHGRRIRPAQL